VGQLSGIAEDNLPFFKAFTQDVLSNRINDIHAIERTLDTMLPFCFDDKILLLYKKVLRGFIHQHPATVKSYIDIYFDMYGNGGDSE